MEFNLKVCVSGISVILLLYCSNDWFFGCNNWVEADRENRVSESARCCWSCKSVRHVEIVKNFRLAAAAAHTSRWVCPLVGCYKKLMLLVGKILGEWRYCSLQETNICGWQQQERNWADQRTDRVINDSRTTNRPRGNVEAAEEDNNTPQQLVWFFAFSLLALLMDSGDDNVVLVIPKSRRFILIFCPSFSAVGKELWRRKN